VCPLSCRRVGRSLTWLRALRCVGDRRFTSCCRCPRHESSEQTNRLHALPSIWCAAKSARVCFAARTRLGVLSRISGFAEFGADGAPAAFAAPVSPRPGAGRPSGPRGDSPRTRPFRVKVRLLISDRALARCAFFLLLRKILRDWLPRRSILRVLSMIWPSRWCEPISAIWSSVT